MPFVYFIQNTLTKHIKVGYTNDVMHRFGQLQSANSEESFDNERETFNNDRQNFDNKVDTFKNPVFANMAEFKAQQKKLD